MLAAGITCPNCGKWIEAGAQICTACGYSRRLARTLTSARGDAGDSSASDQMARGSMEELEIEAEKAYRRAKVRVAEAGRTRYGCWWP